MIRKIIQIDEEKCNGCAACANACHEGAIEMVGGKAKLIRDDYCDGLGDCLPACPTGAITFIEREAKAYDEQAVAQNMARRAAAQGSAAPHAGGCPGSALHTFSTPATAVRSAVSAQNQGAQLNNSAPSQLAQWPCQIKLVPVSAPFFEGADLLIAADCTAFAYASIHENFMRGKVTIIGCPKLDATDYSEKLGEIISQNNIKSVHVLRMEVPCCGGLEAMSKQALDSSGKHIPFEVTTFTLDGHIKA